MRWKYLRYKTSKECFSPMARDTSVSARSPSPSQLCPIVVRMLNCKGARQAIVAGRQRECGRPAFTPAACLWPHATAKGLCACMKTMGYGPQGRIALFLCMRADPIESGQNSNEQAIREAACKLQHSMQNHAHSAMH